MALGHIGDLEFDKNVWLKAQYLEAFKFSTRYSFFKKASTCPYAFIALRDVLDYSDKERFPENKYGPANRKNKDRGTAIYMYFNFDET